MRTIMLTTFAATLFLLGLTGCGGNTKSDAGSTEVIGETGVAEIDRLTSEIAQDPTNAGLYAARASLFYDNKGFDEAIQDLNRALTLDSLNVDYHHLLADIYLDYFQSRLALKTMERAVALYPDRIPTLLKLSELQLFLKKYEESMKTADRVLQQDPQNGDAFFLIGMNLKESGDTIQAINSFQRAVELDPDLIDAWINLGQLHEALGNSIALRYFDSAIEVAPNNPAVRHAKADYLTQIDDLTGALDVYRQIIRLDHQYEEAYFNSGLLLLDLDSLDRAYDQFDLTLKVSPTHIRAFYFRGLTAEMKGDLAQARADYEQALRLAPDYERAQQGLTRLEEVE